MPQIVDCPFSRWADPKMAVVSHYALRNPHVHLSLKKYEGHFLKIELHVKQVQYTHVQCSSMI